MRSQFKSEIKRVSDLLAEGQKSLGEIGMGINQDAEKFENQLKDAGLTKEIINSILAARQGKTSMQVIQTAEDYFKMVSKIHDPDRFTLRSLIRCFSELFANQQGGFPNILNVNIQLQHIQGQKGHSEVQMFIDQVRVQAENIHDIGIGLNSSVGSHGINSC